MDHLQPFTSRAVTLLVMVLTSASFVSCTSTKPSTLRQYQAEPAWNMVQDATAEGNAISAATKIFGIEGIDPELFDKSKREAEARAKDAQTPGKALDEIVNDVSAYLVTAMPKHARAQGAEWRLTLVAGTLVDGTTDKRLGSALDRISFQLQRNTDFRRHFKVLSSKKTEAESIIKDLSGSHPDDIFAPDSTADTGVKTVHPEDLYIMTGRTDVFESNDGLVPVLDTVTLIQVEHPQTRETVLSQEFRRRYVFHPGNLAYISEAENATRKTGDEEDE